MDVSLQQSSPFNHNKHSKTIVMNGISYHSVVIYAVVFEPIGGVIDRDPRVEPRLGRKWEESWPTQVITLIAELHSCLLETTVKGKVK